MKVLLKNLESSVISSYRKWKEFQKNAILHILGIGHFNLLTPSVMHWQCSLLALQVFMNTVLQSFAGGAASLRLSHAVLPVQIFHYLMPVPSTSMLQVSNLQVNFRFDARVRTIRQVPTKFSGLQNPKCVLSLAPKEQVLWISSYRSWAWSWLYEYVTFARFWPLCCKLAENT